MKTVLALTLILAGAQAFAGSPNRAFSQGLTDLVMDMPKDATGADLTCSSDSGKTGLFAALPGDLKGTAVVIKINGVVSTDADAEYIENAKARGYETSRLPDLAVSKITEKDVAGRNGQLSSIAFSSARFSLITVPGTTRTVTHDNGAEGKITFRGLLTTRGLKNITVNCVEEWAL